MEYNLFLTNTQPYEVIGYNGNGSKGLVSVRADKCVDTDLTAM